MSHRADDESRDETTAALATVALSLARRFAGGGTLWCWSPDAVHHAQHVAVEFVHPVIVGTRALPAVAVIDADAVAALRSMARSGDALLVIAPAAAAVGSLLRRAGAWGLTTIWMGAGPVPTRNDADHLLWMADDPAAWHDGRLLLGYHLLWELTQVCVEHPGLLTEGTEEAPVCVTCSDEGRLGEVVRTDGDSSARGTATVRTATGLEQVSTMMVGVVQPGDLVLVHAGTAIALVDA